MRHPSGVRMHAPTSSGTPARAGGRARLSAPWPSPCTRLSRRCKRQLAMRTLRRLGLLTTPAAPLPGRSLAYHHRFHCHLLPPLAASLPPPPGPSSLPPPPCTAPLGLHRLDLPRPGPSLATSRRPPSAALLLPLPSPSPLLLSSPPACCTPASFVLDDLSLLHVAAGVASAFQLLLISYLRS